MENLVAALAARRYYLEGRSKVEIGQELGISRFRVARILEQALRDGIVRVQIDTPAELDLDLAERVADRYGLQQVLVVRSAEDAGDPAAVRRLLGLACAALLPHRLSADDVLGVSWGRTLHALAGVVPPLPRAEVVQMVGSIPSADLSENSLELVRRLGDSTGGRVHALHVPMILESAGLAASLRLAGHVADTLAASSRITCALVGIGAWRPGQSSVRSQLPDDVVADLEEAGAAADVCSTVVDAAGRVISSGGALEDRCIAITTDQLTRIPDVIALAGGAAKAPAIAAVARAGFLRRLITDASAARGLLDLEERPQ